MARVHLGPGQPRPRAAHATCRSTVSMMQRKWAPSSRGEHIPEPPPKQGERSPIDRMAIGALSCLRELGRRVPEDCAVVGCDDIEIAAHTGTVLSLRAGSHPSALGHLRPSSIALPSLQLRVSKPSCHRRGTASGGQEQPGRRLAPLHQGARPARRTAAARPPWSPPAWPGPAGAGRTTGSGSSR